MSPTVREKFLGLFKYAVIAGVLLVALMFTVPASLKFFGYGSQQALHSENDSYFAQPAAVDQSSRLGYEAEAKKLAVSSRARVLRGTFAVQDALTTPP